MGAGVGAGAEAINQYARYGEITSPGKLGTAALGGFVAGGIAGLTLGVGAAAGVASKTVEVVVVNGASSMLGGIAQRVADSASGLGTPNSDTTELGQIALDAGSGGLFGFLGGKHADKLFPIPNVRHEIELLKFANRRSTRGVRIDAARTLARAQATFNSLVGGVSGGIRSEGVKFLWNWITDPPSAQAKKDYEVTETIRYGQ